MTKPIVLLLFLTLSTTALAQKVFTGCDVAFYTQYDREHLLGFDTVVGAARRLFPGISRDYPQEASAEVKINVANGIPKLLAITVKSRFNEDWVEQATKRNLTQLTFLQDTSNYIIVFRYRYNEYTTNTYAEIIGDTITIYTLPRSTFERGLPIHYYKGVVDTQTINGLRIFATTIPEVLTTDQYLHSPSNILVERIIDGDKDSTVVIRNNYPELTETLLVAAANMSKVQLQDDLKRYMQALEIKTTLPIRYFLKYHFHREVCGVYQNR